jgi:DNA-binding response OmpR family regulator
MNSKTRYSTVEDLWVETAQRRLEGEQRNNKTVLIVDDDDNHRWICHQFLIDEGYDVLSARSGKEAREKIMHRLPDLVIRETMVPDIDRLNAMLRRLQGKKKVFVILHTVPLPKGNGSLRSRVDAQVNKGADFDELKATIEACLPRFRKASGDRGGNGAAIHKTKGDLSCTANSSDSRKSRLT